jgi:hypothetical protein
VPYVRKRRWERKKIRSTVIRLKSVTDALGGVPGHGSVGAPERGLKCGGNYSALRVV